MCKCNQMSLYRYTTAALVVLESKTLCLTVTFLRVRLVALTNRMLLLYAGWKLVVCLRLFDFALAQVPYSFLHTLVSESCSNISFTAAGGHVRLVGDTRDEVGVVDCTILGLDGLEYVLILVIVICGPETIRQLRWCADN